MYGYKETCKEDCHGIVACSDILNVTHDENVAINKLILVHLPILHDIEDSSSEIVLFERNLEGSLSLRIVNDAIQCEPHGNCYTFAVSCLNNRYDYYCLYITTTIHKKRLQYYLLCATCPSLFY